YNVKIKPISINGQQPYLVQRDKDKRSTGFTIDGFTLASQRSEGSWPSKLPLLSKIQAIPERNSYFCYLIRQIKIIHEEFFYILFSPIVYFWRVPIHC